MATQATPVTVTNAISASTPVIAAASPTVAQNFFIASTACTITSFNYIYNIGSTSGTLQVYKDSGVINPGAGTSILSGGTAVSLSSVTANTVTSNALTATAATLAMAAGDRLSWLVAGTLTGLSNCVATVTVKLA